MIVPPGEAVIEEIEPTAAVRFTLVICLVGHPRSGASVWMAKAKPLFRSRKFSAVSEMESLDDNSLLFRDVSYTEPAAWFHLAPDKTEPVKTALVNTSPVSFADIEVTREFATSKDGTKIPLNIVRKKGNQAGRQ